MGPISVMDGVTVDGGASPAPFVGMRDKVLQSRSEYDVGSVVCE
jgi:hypothetical protein